MKPKSKTDLSDDIRLAPDIVDWFKRQGKGYHSRINALLRLYMEAQPGEEMG